MTIWRDTVFDVLRFLLRWMHLTGEKCILVSFVLSIRGIYVTMLLRASPKTPIVISSLLNSILLHLCLTWFYHASLQIHRLKFNNFDLTSRVFGGALKNKKKVWDLVMNAELKLASDEKKLMMDKLQGYFTQVRGEELSHLGADVLVDFLTKEIGGIYYNHGIRDAYSLMSGRLEELFELEKY